MIPLSPLRFASLIQGEYPQKAKSKGEKAHVPEIKDILDKFDSIRHSPTCRNSEALELIGTSPTTLTLSTGKGPHADDDKLIKFLRGQKLKNVGIKGNPALSGEVLRDDPPRDWAKIRENANTLHTFRRERDSYFAYVGTQTS